MRPNYRETLSGYRQRLAELEQERTATEQKLGTITAEMEALIQATESLLPLVSEQDSVAAIELLKKIGAATDDVSALNITEGVRTILRSNPDRYFAATDIRTHLVASGFDLTKHANALATIHMVLKRIEQQGDAVCWKAEGKTVYQWSGRQARPVILESTGGLEGTQPMQTSLLAAVASFPDRYGRRESPPLPKRPEKK